MSLEVWAALEPNNAVPWLLIFGMAAGKKDVPAQADAARHIALTTAYDPHLLDRAPLLLSAETTSQKLIIQSSIASLVIGANAAYSMDAIYGFAQYCSESAAVDPLRRASCNNLATKYIDNDQSVIGVSMARIVGKRIGWDAARVQALEDEKDVILGYMSELGADENPFSCAALEKNNEWVRESLIKGERKWARDRAAKSGKSYAEIAEGYRAAARARTAAQQQ